MYSYGKERAFGEILVDSLHYLVVSRKRQYNGEGISLGYLSVATALDGLDRATSTLYGGHPIGTFRQNPYLRGMRFTLYPYHRGGEIFRLQAEALPRVPRFWWVAPRNVPSSLRPVC